jgi:hypothetical protein
MLNRRALAMLRAVGAGRAELTGLIRPDRVVAVGQWARAELTDDGRSALGGTLAAA